MDKRIKKVLIALGAILGAGALVWFGVYILTTGTLEVRTAGNAEVSIFEVQESKVEAQSIGSGPSVSQRLAPGVYTISAVTSAGETRAAVSVQPRQTTGIELEIKPAGSAEQVLPGNAYDIVENNGRLRFLNQSLWQLTQSEPPHQRARAILHGLFPVADVAWTDYNSAFVKLRDGSYEVLVDGDIQRLQYPPGLQPGGDFVPDVSSYDVNGRGGLAVSIEGGIYLYRTLGGSPEKIADTDHDDITVRMSETGSVFAFTESATAESTNGQPVNMLFDSRKKKIPHSLGGRSISAARWNPGGSILSLIIEDSIYTYDVNDNTLERIMKFPPDNQRSITWQDKKTFFMVDDDAVWRVNTKEKKWRRLADTPGPIRHRNAMTLSNNGQALYFGTSSQGLGNSGSLYKIPLSR